MNQIPQTSLRAFLERLGHLKLIDPLTTEAYDLEEYNLWINYLDDSPHGEPWHTSFHASSFPGDSEKACSRKALYGLMAVPNAAPFARAGRAWMDVGKDIETNIVNRWGKAGRLISSDQREDDEYQMGWLEEDVWLTGNTDAVILPPGWNRFHPVEIKAVRHYRFEENKNIPDPKHINQIKTYIGLGHDNLHLQFPQVIVCEKCWAVISLKPGIENILPCPRNCGGKAILLDIEPTVNGTLYYLSMDDPGNITREFRYNYDEEFMRVGKQRLADWKELFKNEQLPQEQEKKHPFEGWGWSQEPCKWCPLKKHVCKPDFQDNITDLRESHLQEFSKGLFPDYDFDLVKNRVLDRWGENE